MWLRCEALGQRWHLYVQLPSEAVENITEMTEHLGGCPKRDILDTVREDDIALANLWIVGYRLQY